MDIVQRVLDEEKRELEKFKSIQVEKHLEAKIDLGYLLCSDPNDLDERSFKYGYGLVTIYHSKRIDQ